jgi:hypothetical protein
MDTPSKRRVRQFQFQIAFSPPTDEAKARWEQRAETLTRWLIHTWQAAQQEVRDANPNAS